MSAKSTSGNKIITINRKASFNFFFKEILEAGIVLKGSEIKSVRDGNVNIAESYAVEKEGEIFLINSHIPIYKQASYSNHNPYSERKLLFNKSVSKISIIGVGMITTPGVTFRMFQALAKKRINIQVISTSEIKISVLIDQKNIKKALNILHKEFKLHK